jgi:hypothetical protein
MGPIIARLTDGDLLGKIKFYALRGFQITSIQMHFHES